ncbi:MAG: hypothetical protein ABIF92_02390 [archaeon]
MQGDYYKGKPIKVVITGDALKQFGELSRVVADEISKGVTKSDHQVLFGAIKRKIDALKLNPACGIHVPRDRVPAEYVKLFEINNLWKLDLPRAWRMLYTIRGSEVDIISLILDILDHRDYERKFDYKKS